MSDKNVGKILRRIDGPTPRKSLSRYVLEKNTVLAVDEDPALKQAQATQSEEIEHTFEEQPFESVSAAPYSDDVIELEHDVIDVDESFESQVTEEVVEDCKEDVSQAESTQGVELDEEENVEEEDQEDNVEEEEDNVEEEEDNVEEEDSSEEEENVAEGEEGEDEDKETDDSDEGEYKTSFALPHRGKLLHVTQNEKKK